MELANTDFLGQNAYPFHFPPINFNLVHGSF